MNTHVHTTHKYIRERVHIDTHDTRVHTWVYTRE